MIITLAELQKAPAVQDQDVIDTLLDYAQTGAGISGRVVIEILKRTQLSEDKLNQLLVAAESGVKKHQHMSSNVPYQSVSPEMNAAAQRRGAWLEVLHYEEQATMNKQMTAMGEAGEYQLVADFIRGKLQSAIQEAM